MPNAREIRDRMGSVRDTQKITNAMYLIASTKLQKAKRDLARTRDYFDALRVEIRRIFKKNPDTSSRYFDAGKKKSEDDKTKCGILVITADKGLAGAYNQSVIKEALSLIKKYPDNRLYVVGEFGRHYFKQHGIPFCEDFYYAAQEVTLQRSRKMCFEVLEDYDSKLTDCIYIVYTDMKNGMESAAISTQLLPLQVSDFNSETVKDESNETTDDINYSFLPDTDSVLNGIVPSYLTGFVYSALVDSFCSEQNARMTAMDSANRNAEEIIRSLNIQYNRVRQASITQEITEVSAGAKAQKRKRQKQMQLQLKKLEEEIL